MKILIDTCILSEVRHPLGNPAVKKAFLSYEENNLFLSVLTLRYGLHIMTCNARHFEGTGTFIIDPIMKNHA